jgi:hypothetical protein
VVLESVEIWLIADSVSLTTLVADEALSSAVTLEDDDDVAANETVSEYVFEPLTIPIEALTLLSASV